MPIYEYRCDEGHTFEVLQSMSEDPVAACEICGAPVQKVLHPVAVHFKGSGFYTTDYGKKKAAANGADPKKEGSAAGEKGSSDAGTKDSKDSKGSAESKPSTPAAAGD